MKKFLLILLAVSTLVIASPVSAADTTDGTTITTNSLEDPGGGRP